ncbi:MAG TPA: LemA family protein [Cyclobacteriaceae bacterium]|nr:LemA family protein [Cyclobacteriaceae bacterium]HMV07887.1 LemA family protein [Cyclobacteriaceae bacterium]HMV88155.1 LemA family protein [Cyclobacteriaceae bacterium]HMW99021.1 LemA family protein [Cyclobacteriaceae bacterium]HMX48345.1 LemA family protein [Cyclobacteriaceae bacterium]
MSRGLITTLVIVGIIIVFVGGFFMWGTGVYDSAVASQEEVNKTFADVQAAYQRRADLVPNLVATVKGAAENEKSILVQVTQARAGIVNAKTPEDLELAGRQINTAINLAFEAYPQIRSTENFQDLQSQLEGTENRINVARTRYNESVASYNTYVRGYFKKMALNMFGSGEDFSVRKGFEAAAGSEKAPEVKF